MADHGTRTVIEQLGPLLRGMDSNPLFHASLGSKELFHTNVLAWLCKEYPKGMSEVLGVLGTCPHAKAEPPLREKHDLDLVLRFEGRKPLVIENKVKSLPDRAQLLGYDRAINKHYPGAKRLLLSLVRPEFGSRWTYLSYGELTCRLRRMAGKLSGFDGELVLRWCDLLDDLVALTEIVTIKDSSEDYFFLEAYGRLQERRLHGLVYRLRAQQALSRIVESLKSAEEGWLTYDGPPDAFIKQQNRKPLLAFGTGFTNERPIIDVHCKLPGRPCVVGVQIQANEFRLFGRVVEDKGSVRAKSISNLEERKSHWRDKKTRWAHAVKECVPGCFDFNEFDAFIGEEKRRGPHRAEYPLPKDGNDDAYNGFEPDFVYRSKRLVRWPGAKKGEDGDLPTQMTVGDVVKLAVRQVGCILRA